jgi:hypothetical protein
MRRARSSERGVTVVTFLLVVGAVALIGWVVGYGPAYWDNVGVNRVLKEAANMCYLEPSDEKVKDFVFRELHRMFDTGERDQSGYATMNIDVQRDDLRLERTDTPKKWVHLWLTYSRTVRLPVVNQERMVTFVDHAEQDLSPVKW